MRFWFTLAVAALGVSAIAANCEAVDEFNPFEDRSPPPEYTPYDYGTAFGEAPYGFSSWQEYAAFTKALLAGGGAGAAAGMQTDLPAELPSLLSQDTDGNGVVTVLPVQVEGPDGSPVGLIPQEVPSGSVVTFNDDGTVTVVLP